jgi:hypothetical protein
LGRSAFHSVRSEFTPALSLAGELEKIGEARNDVAAQLLGRLLNRSFHFARPEDRVAAEAYGLFCGFGVSM